MFRPADRQHLKEVLETGTSSRPSEQRGATLVGSTRANGRIWPPANGTSARSVFAVPLLGMPVDAPRGSESAGGYLGRVAIGRGHHWTSLPPVHRESEQVRAAVVAGSVEVVSSAGHVVEVEVRD
jgi:hypothetical protein